MEEAVIGEVQLRSPRYSERVKALLLASLIFLVACAVPPSRLDPETAANIERLRELFAREGEAELATRLFKPGAIDVEVEDAHVCDIAEEISRQVGCRIADPGDVGESVTLSLRRIHWLDALEIIARKAKCELVARADGSFAFQPWERLVFNWQDEPLKYALVLLGAHSDEPVLVAPDVHGAITMQKDGCGDSRLSAHWLDEVLRDRGLHATRRGRILVVSHVDLGPDVAMPMWRRGAGYFVAWHAPAKSWFEMLERVAGHSVEHGDQPVVYAYLGPVSPEEVQQASALASRVPCRRELEDLCRPTPLPSGRVIYLRLQGTATSLSEPLAIVEGRVVAAGDELSPGLKVSRIETFRLVLSENGREAILER